MVWPIDRPCCSRGSKEKETLIWTNSFAVEALEERLKKMRVQLGSVRKNGIQNNFLSFGETIHEAANAADSSEPGKPYKLHGEVIYNYVSCNSVFPFVLYYFCTRCLFILYMLFSSYFSLPSNTCILGYSCNSDKRVLITQFFCFIFVSNFVMCSKM